MQVREQTLAASARRSQIIESAITTIARLGYAQTSFAKIAEQACISSTRLISYHFDDKSELMRAVVEAVLSKAAGYMRPRLDAAVGYRAKLAAYLEANIGYIAEHPDEIRAVIDVVTNARTDGGAPLFQGAGADPAVSLLTAHLRAGQEAGEFRQFDPLVMAVSIRATIDAAAGLVTVDGHDLVAHGQELIELFDHATRKEP